jgi:hypothetical protein
MSFDHYCARLKKAAWSWLEPKFCRFLCPLRNKNRRCGRAEKRAARQAERREREAD